MFSYPLSQVSDLDGCKMLRKLFQMIASAQIIERSSFYAAVMLAYDNGSTSWTSSSHIIQLSIVFYQLQSIFVGMIPLFIHVKEYKLIIIVIMMMCEIWS